jgi:1-acyl-sn-glycerol-3-phosphate acyltransferase
MDPSALWYELSRAACAVGMTFGFSLRTEGRRHVPARGPALLIANHQSFLDPILIAVAARRRPGALARKTLFGHPAFAWLIRSFNAIPVDQEGIGIEGLRVAIDFLRQERVLMVFPEGGRTSDGNIQPLMPGIQLLIKRAAAPVVPVGIAGAYAAWPCWRPYPIPAPLFFPANKRCLAVSISPALEARYLASLPREQLLSALSAELQKARDRAERLCRKE